MSFKSICITVFIGLLAFFGAIYTVSHLKKVDVGRVGVVYSMAGGVQDETLGQGFHFISPFQHVKEFTVGNEQLILTKDKREGSKEDESFYVATSDNAGIAISFQMSYRFLPDKVVETYKKFKGLDGEDIVNSRVRTVLKADISEITTNYSIMDIYSGNRSEINAKITEKLNEKFQKAYGIEVLDASIIDAHPDETLKKAINDRVKALQEKQQAEAEQAKLKVEKETELMQAQADADIKKAKAEADAAVTITKAQAEAESNKKIAESITPELIKMKEAEARLKHGWVTITGADTIVKEK